MLTRDATAARIQRSLIDSWKTGVMRMQPLCMTLYPSYLLGCAARRCIALKAWIRTTSDQSRDEILAGFLKGAALSVTQIMEGARVARIRYTIDFRDGKNIICSDSGHDCICLDVDSVTALNTLLGPNRNFGYLGYLDDIYAEKVELPHSEIARIASTKASKVGCGDVNALPFELRDAAGKALSPESLRPNLGLEVHVDVCEDGWVCGICLEGTHDLDGGHSTMAKLACGHTYHGMCLSAWLIDHPSCPTCRRSAPRSTSMNCVLEGSAWAMLPIDVVHDDVMTDMQVLLNTARARSSNGTPPHLRSGRSAARFHPHNPDFFSSRPAVDWELPCEQKCRRGLPRPWLCSWGVVESLSRWLSHCGPWFVSMD